MLHRSESGISTWIWHGIPAPDPRQCSKPSPSHRSELQNTPLLLDVASWQSPVSRRKQVAEEKSLQNDGKEWDKTESGWGNDNKCDRKRRKRPKASPDTHALPGVGDTMSTRLQFCCCSSVTVLQWQLLTDTLFCYLARFSLKHHSPTHIYIYTYLDTHTPWDYIWYNTFQRLIKGRASVILCTTRIRLFTDCNETTEYCFN